MTKDFIHFMYVPFTGLGLHKGFRGNKWFKHRIEVFKNYTLKGLLNQTERHFFLWVSFRPEEEYNPLTIELWKYLNNLKSFPFLFTFGGVMFWDDKYKNDNLFERLRLTLPEMGRMEDYKWVYVTIQPSDDIYHRSAVEEIQKQEPAIKKAFGFERGFFLNVQTHQLAEYNPDTLPPFSTIVFPKEVFLDPKKHFKYIGPYKSHEYVKDIFDFEILPGRGFCVLVHGDNISTVWNHPFKGREIIEEEKKELFEMFGIADSKIIKRRVSMGLILRTVFNVLPFNKQLRGLYHWFRENVSTK